MTYRNSIDGQRTLNIKETGIDRTELNGRTPSDRFPVTAVLEVE